MKLFQRLLVAPAALGLMAPLASNADVTAVSNDSDFSSEVFEARVDGVEAQLGEVMAGQFSSSTTMSGKAAFVLGSVNDDSQQDADGDQIDDEMTMNYMYQLNMNTSFTGEDLLYTRIKTGNFSKADLNPSDPDDYNSGRFSNKLNTDYLAVSNQNGGSLKVDKIWYQFPIADSLQAWVGPRIENYYMLASAPSIYKPVTKQFALGGNASTYGSSTSPGFGIAWTQQVDDPSEGRFAVSTNYTAKDGDDSSVGLFNDEGGEFFLTKVEYGTPQWQVSAAVAKKTGGEEYDGYYHTTAGHDYDGDLTSIGIRAYWKPDTTGSLPEVQLGYDAASVDDAEDHPDEMTAWMVGLGWKDLFMDGNRAGLAFGSRQSATSFEGTYANDPDPEDDNLAWEAYYTFKVNDSVTVTPAVFGASDVVEEDNDVSGALLLTEFRF